MIERMAGIDQEKCIGCGVCMSYASSDLISVEAKARLIKQPTTEEEKRQYTDAEDACPMHAILPLE